MTCKIWDLSKPSALNYTGKMKRLLIICFFMVCSLVIFGSSSLLLQQSQGGFERDHKYAGQSFSGIFEETKLLNRAERLYLLLDLFMVFLTRSSLALLLVPVNTKVEAPKPSLTPEEMKIKAQELRYWLAFFHFPPMDLIMLRNGIQVPKTAEWLERARKKKEEEDKRMEREKEKGANPDLGVEIFFAFLSFFGKFKSVSLSSSDLFLVKSFFLALSKVSNPILFLPAKFLWSSKAPSKVKALAWLVAHGKVNTNDKLQLRRPYKSLCPQWCILCKGNGESINHLFLHCSVTIGLWHKLFNLAGLVWVPPRSFEDMLVIAFKGLGNSLRGKTLWQIACLNLVWMVWQERNNRIFEDKGRMEEMLWDLILFYSSLWASCTVAFRGVPLSVLQLNWIAVCASKV
ncbi:hypothetical protein CK203_063062 [Vitis vinifera]|uniref:Reverse transcriptase zinc-binding domain-containing protein n=1 Tax=Vitis vinifera TaxID=29760 RepID=A0A438G607_VITVI|nr:hypothetical protein CK203_063062 [Vitis vinifera]